MQHDDERTRLLKLLRHEREHAKITGIVAKARDFLQRTGRIRAPAELGQAQAIQLWQLSQQIEIFGERHGNSWQATFNVNPNQIVAALQNKKTVRCQSPEITQKSGEIRTY
jgi:hypothetical protein